MIGYDFSTLRPEEVEVTDTELTEYTARMKETKDFLMDLGLGEEEYFMEYTEWKARRKPGQQASLRDFLREAVSSEASRYTSEQWEEELNNRTEHLRSLIADSIMKLPFDKGKDLFKKSQKLLSDEDYINVMGKVITKLGQEIIQEDKQSVVIQPSDWHTKYKDRLARAKETAKRVWELMNTPNGYVPQEPQGSLGDVLKKAVQKARGKLSRPAGTETGKAEENTPIEETETWPMAVPSVLGGYMPGINAERQAENKMEEKRQLPEGPLDKILRGLAEFESGKYGDDLWDKTKERKERRTIKEIVDNQTHTYEARLPQEMIAGLDQIFKMR